MRVARVAMGSGFPINFANLDEYSLKAITRRTRDMIYIGNAN